MKTFSKIDSVRTKLVVTFFFLGALLIPSPAYHYHQIKGALATTYEKLAYKTPPLPKKMGKTDPSIIAKTIHINGEDHPYNGSIIERADGGYHLFFRRDIKRAKPNRFGVAYDSQICAARLDENFKHIDPTYTPLKTPSSDAQDPRVLRVNGRLVMVYNDQLDTAVYARRVHTAIIDESTYEILSDVQLDEHIQRIEKNWTPFLYQNVLHYVYKASPHKVLAHRDLSSSTIEHLTFPHDLLNKFEWSKKYGEPRGGTPAKLIDGEYLSFFHSTWYHQRTKTMWYALGAYTFESSPPFRITSITRSPILFEGIYGTPHAHSATPSLRCIYPAGFVEDSDNNIHLSCGENDCSTKIISIPRSTLKQALVSISKPGSISSN